MVKVENLRAIRGGKAVDVEYLGCLLWSTVSDVLKIPAEDLKEALTKNGLEKFMPRKINPNDAFRRVTKLFETRREPYGKNTYINLLVRSVSSGNKNVRQLVREVVDGKNVRLEYKPVVQFEIEKENLSIIPLVNDLTPQEIEIMNKLPGLHDEALHYYDGTHIRYVIKNILHVCNPVSVRPNGGVSFISQKNMKTIEAVKKLAKQLNEYQGNVKMWSVPVIDAYEHREMIEESLEEQVLSGSNSLIREMREIIEDPGRTVGVKAAKGFADRIKEMKNTVAEYEDLLEYQAIKARENLELARRLAVKLMDVVSAE